MAKDPAFLFYSSDFLTGTMFMTNEQVGLYIRMLCAQHQHGGRIDTNVLRTQCDGITNGIQVYNKFEHDDTGSFNPRLEKEMGLRKEKSLKAAESVKKRWEKHNSDNTYDRNTNVLRSESVNENENVIENKDEVVIEKKSRERFSKPSPQEIHAYMTEKNSLAGNVWDKTMIDTESKKYFNYYEANGWRVGKNPMKDWQAACRNWMNNANQYQTKTDGKQRAQQQIDAYFEECKQIVIASGTAANSGNHSG